MAEVCDLTSSWLKKYNEEAPHDALGDLSPAEYLAVMIGAETSSYAWSQSGEVYDTCLLINAS